MDNLLHCNKVLSCKKKKFLDNIKILKAPKKHALIFSKKQTFGLHLKYLENAYMGFHIFLKKFRA